MARNRSLGGAAALSLVLLGAIALVARCTSSHHYLAAPVFPGKDATLDLEGMPRYQSDVAAYREAMEGYVWGPVASRVASMHCPDFGADTTKPPRSIAFCVGDKHTLSVAILGDDGKTVKGFAADVLVSSDPQGLTGLTTVKAADGLAVLDALTLSPGTYELIATTSGLTTTSRSFSVGPDLERAKYFRNKISDRLMGDIDHVYGEYVGALYSGRGFEALTADIVNLGLSAASTISVVTNTKTILSALATAAGGIGLSWDKNFFAQQTFAALAIAMQARRSQAAATIVRNQDVDASEYTLEATRRDLIAYFYAGTLPGALQEIQEEAARASNAAFASPTSQAPPATALPHGTPPTSTPTATAPPTGSTVRRGGTATPTATPAAPTAMLPVPTATPTRGPRRSLEHLH